MQVFMIVPVIAVVCIGLIAGIFLGDRAGAAYARPQLSVSSFVQLQQIVHVHFVKMMPPLIFAALLTGLAWLLMVRAQWKTAGFWLIAVSTGAIFANLVMTRVVNVPINEQLMTWNIAAPPANVRELWAPWERVHTIRTVVAVCAFVLEVVALGVARI